MIINDEVICAIDFSLPTVSKPCWEFTTDLLSPLHALQDESILNLININVDLSLSFPIAHFRFYNDDSAFVHGGVDRPGEVSNPVFGRESISKKIQSLNFCDCHAKILQVDSMETIGNGVVVQVIILVWLILTYH